MLKRIMMAAGLTAALAMPALAAEDAAQAAQPAQKEDKVTCETMLQELDTALQNGKLAEAVKQQLEKAREMATGQMKAGDEAGCKETVSKVLEVVKG